MTTTLDQVPAPDTTCDVCQAWPLNHCHGLDGHPLPIPHAERLETTPIHDQLLNDRSSTNSLPSPRRADAGTLQVAATPGKRGSLTRPAPSTRAPKPEAGQGTHHRDLTRVVTR